MSEPTLQDCINYMRSKIKQMEKHPRNYEFNLPYYRKTVELLETRKTDDETFEWCHDCKEYDKKEHCCLRWTKVIRDTVEELEKDRKCGMISEYTPDRIKGKDEKGYFVMERTCIHTDGTPDEWETVCYEPFEKEGEKNDYPKT